MKNISVRKIRGVTKNEMNKRLPNHEAEIS